MQFLSQQIYWSVRSQHSLRLNQSKTVCLINIQKFPKSHFFLFSCHHVKYQLPPKGRSILIMQNLTHTVFLTKTSRKCLNAAYYFLYFCVEHTSSSLIYSNSRFFFHNIDSQPCFLLSRKILNSQAYFDLQIHCSCICMVYAWESYFFSCQILT